MISGDLVTGSSRGIGAAILLKLASCGADVVVNYVSSQAPAESVAAKAREFGVKAICIRADVSKREEIANLFDQAKKELGRVDVVMSNSGIEHFGDLETVKEEEIDRVLAVNVKAQFFVAQEAHKYLEDGGRLILISSISAVWVSVLKGINRLGSVLTLTIGRPSSCPLLGVKGGHHRHGQMSGMRLWKPKHHRQLHCPWRYKV